MADTDYEIILYRKGTAGTITMAADSSSYVISGSRKLFRAENEISKLEFSLSNGSTTATQNFLSSSFAGWSGGVTGALQLGDYVRYSLYPTSAPTTKTQYFYGKITDMQQTQDGQLKITALDYLKKLDREYARLFYAGYRDSIVKTATWSSGTVAISGLTDTNIVAPIAYAALAIDDKKETIGSSTQKASENIVTGNVAQAYLATQDGMIGLKVALHNPDGLRTGTIKVALQADNGSGAPSGTDMASDTAYLDGTTTAWVDFDIDFTTGGVPVMMVANKKYWIVFSYVSGNLLTGATYTVKPTATYPIQNHLWKSDGTNWASQANESIKMDVHTVNYSPVDPDNYSFDDSTDSVYCVVDTVAPVATQSFVTPVRGLVSYFYGTLTNQQIADKILGLNTGLSTGSSANQVTTSGTFSTSGKKLIESLRELANQYMTSGTWSGYQLAFAHLDNLDGSHTVKFGKKLTTADASSVTFSHGFDTATDSEKRIISYSGLRKKTDLRPPAVTVIGKDQTDNPICYTVTDQALADSFANRMEGFANSLKIVDEGITTHASVRARAEGTLASYQTNVWEGDIVVSGVYPDLIDTASASASYGSGKVITLNLSPLGIVATKFKVKAVITEANQTTITLSNADVMIENAQKYYNAKTQLTESFFAPVGLVDNIYVAVYCDEVADYSPGYMQLYYSVGGAVPGLSKAPTKHTQAMLNLNVYHCEFERDDGNTNGTNIGVIRLRAAAGSGTYIDYDLVVTGPPAKNEGFEKFKTSRLIVDFLTKMA